MNDLIARSPVHDHLEALGATWRDGIAASLGDAAGEKHKAQIAGVCDLSAIPKVGVKGPNAIAWAKAQGVTVPDDMFAVSAHRDGLVVRSGGDELFMENVDLPQLGDDEPGVYRCRRDDATFILTGKRVHDVTTQTCGVNLARESEGKAVYTRVAGVSCAVLPQTIDGRRAYRVWLDWTFADYLWEQLTQIAGELGGGPIGADAIAAKPGVS